MSTGRGVIPFLLRLDSIAKSFGSVRALRGVSFELRAGEVHALLGENGAGKSTLIRIITGAHHPDRGGIEVDGRVVDRLTPARAHALGIACIYQQPALFADLTVAENIALRLDPPRRFRRVGWASRRTRARELLGRMGAAIHPDAEVRELSMPEQQLVEIACVLGAGARIVLMDEPTASLTRREQQLLFGVVRELRSAGAGIVYISHRMEEIFALADRVTVLRDGESVGTRWIRRAQAAAAGARPPGGPGPQVAESAKEPSPLPEPVLDDSPAAQTELIRMMVGREVSHIHPPRLREPGDFTVEISRLSCRAGGIHEVNLRIRAGEIVGMAGLVGAGRTELARVLFGITPADAGEIRLNDRPVTIRSPGDALAAGIAYLPEDRRRHGVIGPMSIAQNISLGSLSRLFPGGWLRRGDERNLALESIRRLAVRAPGPDAPVAHLSGGNQQKVALARWLAARPVFLILDEPTQGVDVGAKSEIHRIMRELASEGMALLMISSDLPEVIGMSDRIVVMRGGTIVAEKPAGCDPHEVMAAALGRAGDPR